MNVKNMPSEKKAGIKGHRFCDSFYTKYLELASPQRQKTKQNKTDQCLPNDGGNREWEVTT